MNQEACASLPAPERQDTAFVEAPDCCCPPTRPEQGEGAAATLAAPLQDLELERSLVATGHCHRRTLSALSQQQLSRDIERDVLAGLPLELRPSGIDSSGPRLRVERVRGDSRAIDVTVVHTFRAHFDDELPASPDPASLQRPTAAAPSAAASAAADEEQQARSGGLGGTSLRVEELPNSSSDSLEPGGHHPAGCSCAPAGEASAPPRLTCRVEMPDSPRGSSGSLSSCVAATAAAAALAAISRSGSGASMPTPSATGEPSARQPSAAEPSSGGLDSEPSGGAGGMAGVAAAAVDGAAQQLPQDAPTLPAAQQQHQSSQQQQQQQQRSLQQQAQHAAADVGTPVAPPATWKPAGAAAAEVQRRFSQDQAWEGLQRQRLSMSRQDSLMPYEINPHDILVGERLAVGGFAEVFVGRYQGTAVAIKLLLSVDEHGQESFRAEVHLLERLRHPNIVLFMGICTRPYLAIVSEYMARGSLFRMLRRGGNRPLPPKLQRSVAVSVARGMAYLHSRTPPLLHLDLKSPNILLDERWRVKIADFGLSRLKSNASCMQGTGAGTPEWMSPEVLRSETYDERADVYSYGVVLWECLTGQQPWQGLHPMQVVGAVGFQGKQLPTEGLEGDPFLVALCRRCMASDPRRRPTFPEILQELEANCAPRSRSNSLGSQTLGNAAATVEPADATPANGGTPGLPPLRLPAAAMPRRGGRCAAAAATEAGAGSAQRYGGHEDSPFAPSGPLPAAPASAASLPAAFAAAEAAAAAVAAYHNASPRFAAQQQQQQQQQPSPFAAAAAPAAPAPAAAAAGLSLHPAYSITNDSPFAQLPPFGSGSDDEEDGGSMQRGLGSGPGGLDVIPEGSSTGGGNSSTAGPSSSAAAQQQAAAAAAVAAEAAGELSQQLEGCSLSGRRSTQRSSSGEAMSSVSRLSSGSLVREPGSPLITLLDVVGTRPAASGAASVLTRQRSASALEEGSSSPAGKAAGEAVPALDALGA
ncbi:hypothetical protein ABPG75_008961 [Micractinium tetrahymenae]